jgi:hypothetical protein
MIQAKHKTVIVFGVLGLVILAWQCPVSAAVVWDETTNGDLSNFIASPTHFPFSSELENSVVNASVGGSSDPNIGDGYDVLEFVVAIEGRLEELRFDSYNGISDSNFDIYLFGSLLLSTTVSSTDVDRNYVEDIRDANPSTILSGFFAVQITNFISVPHPYSMTYVATVPEPSTLLLACLAGCALLGRRRRI